MSIYEHVETLLRGITIPKSVRKAISDKPAQTVTLGIINQPFHKYKGLSTFTEAHPELWVALQKLAHDIDMAHEFTSVTINYNVTCKPHRDRRNTGTTMIVGVGDYTGGELVIEETDIDIRHRPHYFNGYLRTHYNRPHVGQRWSLMFYRIRGQAPLVHRPEDVPILREVYYGNQYHSGKLGFGIERGDRWVDIGAHIGCFSRKVLDNGGSVVAYEPDPDSYSVLIKNIPPELAHNCAVGADTRDSTLIKGSRPYFNKMSDVAGNCHQLAFRSVVEDGCCVKMDVEGTEISILDNCSFEGIHKMVLAYHIAVDRSRTNFERRIKKLREYFDVYHQPIQSETMNFFPNEIIVYCMPKTKCFSSILAAAPPMTAE